MTELTNQVANRHIGSDFDDFLVEEVNAVAKKRVTDWLCRERATNRKIDGARKFRNSGKAKCKT